MLRAGGAISVREWLDSRIPSPPEELAAEMSAFAEDRVCSSPEELAELLLTEAQLLLSSLKDDRSGAAKLLAADALITYAIEAASERCETIDAFATAAIATIAGSVSRGAEET